MWGAKREMAYPVDCGVVTSQTEDGFRSQIVRCTNDLLLARRCSSRRGVRTQVVRKLGRKRLERAVGELLGVAVPPERQETRSQRLRPARFARVICKGEIRGRTKSRERWRPVVEVRTSTGHELGCEHGRGSKVCGINRGGSRTGTTSRVTTDTSIGHEPRSAGLTTEETNPAQTEVGQLEVTMLIDEQVVRLQITVGRFFSGIPREKRGDSTHRCTMPRWCRYSRPSVTSAT